MLLPVKWEAQRQDNLEGVEEAEDVVFIVPNWARSDPRRPHELLGRHRECYVPFWSK